MKKLDDLLASVSRSFYLSLRFLPERMRDGVSCAYLLARATDTVADAATLPERERLDLLNIMAELISGAASGNDLALARIAESCSDSLSHKGEKELLCRFGECLDLMNALPAGQVFLIRKVLHTIIEGQMWDLEFFLQNNCVESAEGLDVYTYRVAGCVGEFWTEMGFLCYSGGFAVLPEDEMREMGISYGKGLQLVNVLRDRNEDAQRGRVYLPGGGDGETLRLWLDQARENLGRGVRYAAALKGFKSRFATVLPAYLGLRTLKLLESPEGMRTFKAKITRRQVYASMLKALVFAVRKPRQDRP